MKFRKFRRDAAPVRGSAIALTALLAVAAAAPAPADTLADALVKAYNSTPSLAVQRAALRALDEQEYQEEAAGLGSVDATASYGVRSSDGGVRLGGTGGRTESDPFSLGVTGSIPIYSGGRIENAAAAARQGVMAGRADVVSTEQEVLLAAVTAYENVRRDLGLVDVARSNVRVISEQLRAARNRFEVGEVTRTDVAQAEARLAAARAQLASATGSLARSRQAYVAAIGEPPGELETPPPLPPLPAAEEEALALGEANHPELQAARFDVRRAGFTVKQAIGGTLPTVSLQGEASYAQGSVLSNDGARGEQNAVGVTVQGSVPLWSGGRNPSAVREAQARLAQSQAAVHDVARRIREAVSNAWSGLEVARTSITAAREQIRAARIAFEGVRQEATLGSRTTLDVLDADQELQNARADLIRALRDEYVAGYTLLSAIGSLNVGHLGLDVDRYDPDGYRAEIKADPYGYPRDESTEWSSPLKP